MGGVFRVEDTTLERQVALKVISVSDPDGAWLVRLSQEARIIARLEHPGIVRGTTWEFFRMGVLTTR